MAAIDTSSAVKRENYQSFTQDFALAISGSASDTAKVMNSIPGMVIDDVQASSGQVTSGAFSVGDIASGVRYISSTSVNGAAVTARLNVPTTLSSGVVTAGAGFKYTTNAEEIRITITGATFSAVPMYVRITYHIEL